MDKRDALEELLISHEAPQKGIAARAASTTAILIRDPPAGAQACEERLS